MTQQATGAICRCIFPTFTSDIIHALKQDGIALNSNAKWAGREVNEALTPLGAKREKRSVGNIKGWGWLGVSERSPGSRMGIIQPQANAATWSPGAVAPSTP